MQKQHAAGQRTLPGTIIRAIVWVAAMGLLLAGCQEKSREKALEEASGLMAAGNPKGAMVIYRTLLERDPKDSQTRYDLALAYLALGKTRLAETEAQRLADGPNPPDRLPLLRGKVYVAADKTDAALKELSDFLGRFPDSAEAWEYKGHAYARAGNMPEAAKAYEQSLALAPDGTEARIGLVRVRMEQGRLQDARAVLDGLLAARPEDYAGLRLLGQIQAQGEDFAGASETFGRLAAKYPKAIEARYDAAFYLLADKGATGDVENVARALIKEYPTRPEGHKLLGLVELTRGASAQAVSDFQHALRIMPGTQTRYYLAQAYAGDGRNETAISELAIVLDEAPGYARARQLLAGLHLRMNRPDAAIAELEKVLEYHPDDAASKRMLGDIHLARRQYDKSLAAYDAIPADSAQAVPADLQKSRILAMRGQGAQAEAALRQALAKAPDNLEVRLTLAAMLAGRDLPDAAVAVLEQPGLAPAGQAQALLAQAGILAARGRADDALARLETAKGLDPSLTAPYHVAAAILLAGHDTARGLEQYQSLLARDPRDAAAHAAYADRLEELGRLDEAREHLTLAAASGTCDAGLDLTAFFARRGDAGAALAALEGAQPACGDALPALVAMARLQAALGNESQALAAIRKIEAVDQDAALAERFRLSMSLGHWERAAAEASKLLERRSAASGDIARASTLVEQGDLSGAGRIIRNVLAGESDDTGARFGLAALLMQMGRTPEAADCFAAGAGKEASTSVATGPANAPEQPAANHGVALWERESVWRGARTVPAVLDALAIVSLDKPQQAGRALQYALAANVVGGDSPRVLDTLGAAFLKNDRRSDAIFILEKAALLAPKNQEIAQHLSSASYAK